MTLLVLSVTGSDRPGLTKALSAAVLSAGGNWLESHLSLLGGLYVGSVLVELADGKVEALRAAVSAVDAQGLEVRIAPALESANQKGETLEFNVVGQDRPGIVNRVTAAISELGGNIETFETWLSAEAQSGARLFNMTAHVRLPQGLSAGKVQSALEAISGEIMVDVVVRS
jgi:glycine cleavage system regulatory protein